MQNQSDVVVYGVFVDVEVVQLWVCVIEELWQGCEFNFGFGSGGLVFEIVVVQYDFVSVDDVYQLLLLWNFVHVGIIGYECEDMWGCYFQIVGCVIESEFEIVDFVGDQFWFGRV